MADNTMLSQEEVDALLRASVGGMPGDDDDSPEISPDFALDKLQQAEPGLDAFLDDGEKDALGEIGNISMGSASTTLSEILQQKVIITSPNVSIQTQRSLFETFQVPYLVIQVEFKDGLDGYNILIIKLRDAIIMADLMMGGDGLNPADQITEIEISAASEAMNQMIGTASTSLATLFGRKVNISPPITSVLENQGNIEFKIPIEENVAVVSFNMKIGDLVDTEIMQVLSIKTAKKEAALLWHSLMGSPLPDEDRLDEQMAETVEEEEPEDSWLSKDLWPDQGGEQAGPSVEEEVSRFPTQPVQSPRPQAPPAAPSAAPADYGQSQIHPPDPRRGYEQPQPQGLSFPGLTPVEQRKMELLLDVPLKVSVVLGRTRRPIKEVLNLTPGAIVELNSLVDEPVEVLVNGTLVARGEVVVVNENFGVRITSIISPEERLKQLRE